MIRSSKCPRRLIYPPKKTKIEKAVRCSPLELDERAWLAITRDIRVATGLRAGSPTRWGGAILGWQHTARNHAGAHHCLLRRKLTN